MWEDYRNEVGDIKIASCLLNQLEQASPTDMSIDYPTVPLREEVKGNLFSLYLKSSDDTALSMIEDNMVGREIRKVFLKAKTNGTDLLKIANRKEVDHINPLVSRLHQQGLLKATDSVELTPLGMVAKKYIEREYHHVLDMAVRHEVPRGPSGRRYTL